MSSVSCGDGPAGPIGGGCWRQGRRGRSTFVICSLRRRSACLPARGIRSPRCRGGRRAGFPPDNDVDCRAQPGRVRKHLSARARPAPSTHCRRRPDPPCGGQIPPDALSAALALCRRIGSPARAGLVAGVAAHAGRCRRADAVLRLLVAVERAPGPVSSEPAGRGTLPAGWRSSRTSGRTTPTTSCTGARWSRKPTRSRAQRWSGERAPAAGAHLPAASPERRETVAGECLGCSTPFAIDVRLPRPATCPDCREPTCSPARTLRVRPGRAARRSTRHGSGTPSVDVALNLLASQAPAGTARAAAPARALHTSCPARTGCEPAAPEGSVR